MDEITKLKKRIDDLEKWKKERENQQIVFPLDARSIEILNKYFMRLDLPNGEIVHTNASGKDTVQYAGIQADKSFVVSYNDYIRYTADATTDYVDIASGYIEEDTEIVIYTSGTVPGGLSTAIPYYAKNSTGKRFQLATTPGGAAVNITSSGTGVQYLVVF